MTGFASDDIVAARRQPEAKGGDIVLARIEQDVTPKPIEIGPTTEDAEIIGIVAGAIVGTRRGPG